MGHEEAQKREFNRTHRSHHRQELRDDRFRRVHRLLLAGNPSSLWNPAKCMTRLILALYQADVEDLSE